MPYGKIHPSALEKNAEYFMAHAYNLAIDAWNADEVPIGAVLVYEEEIISSAIIKHACRPTPPLMQK